MYIYIREILIDFNEEITNQIYEFDRIIFTRAWKVKYVWER